MIKFPEGLAYFDTVGVIYDETDGLNFSPDYGMLRNLFADPARAANKRYADVLREYLRSETIAPLPLLRLATAYPDTVDCGTFLPGWPAVLSLRCRLRTSRPAGA